MVSIKHLLARYLKRFREYLPLSWQRRIFHLVTVKTKGRTAQGRVLLSYAIHAAGMPEDHLSFRYHGCPWMSNKILAIFNKQGFTVDCIHYTDNTFIPEINYDIIFSLTCDLLRLAAFSPEPEKIIKIYHPGISSIDYNNATEIARIEELERRRPGAWYWPKRQEPHERLQNKTLELADYVVFLGNDFVVQTFDKRYHHKMVPVTVYATPSYIKKEEEYVSPSEREFIWHFGEGAVRKGLDYALEVFAKHPEWVLHVTGLVERERDFMRIYRRELMELPNIKLHGYLAPGSEVFTTILKRCFAFVAPSCTESISTASATMMRAGLYPIISRDTGIILPKGGGTYIEPCTIEELEKCVARVYALSDGELKRQVGITHRYALTQFSKEKFDQDMRTFITSVLLQEGYPVVPG